MELFYPGKKDRNEILNMSTPYSFSQKWNTKRNLLIEGDNFLSMHSLLYHYSLKGKIDFIYIDPPFATNSTFTIGDERASTISSSKNDTIAYQDILVGESFIEFCISSCK